MCDEFTVETVETTEEIEVTETVEIETVPEDIPDIIPEDTETEEIVEVEETTEVEEEIIDEIPEDVEEKPVEFVPDITDASQNIFSGFETDEAMNGSDVFVKGDNYDKFKEDYYNAEESEYTAYDEPVETEIPASSIEGIHIGEREAQDSSIFWSQHESGGTADSFREIASHIPEVKEQLANGATLDEICMDENLESCANIYFRNKPKVVDHGDYYEFDSNGRHRILAARSLGYDIPVEIIGKRQ